MKLPLSFGAETARTMLNGALPDLLLLDWMLPGQSGLAFAKQLRTDARTKDLPVIMVTARTDEADRVAGLEAWVDDYVTKPFSTRELKARIKSVLRRRAPEAAQERLSAGSLDLDPVAHRVSVDPSAFTLALSCSTRYGATTSTSRSARWTCTSAGCGSLWSRSGRTG